MITSGLGKGTMRPKIAEFPAHDQRGMFRGQEKGYGGRGCQKALFTLTRNGKKREPALRPAPLRLSHQDYSSWSWSFLPGERRADEAEEAVGSFIGTRAVVAAIALKKISIRPRKVRPIRR